MMVSPILNPTGSHSSVCRYCGETGEEASDDPAPGVCPTCLDQKLNALTIRLAAFMGRKKKRPTYAEGVGFLMPALIELGITPEFTLQAVASLMRSNGQN